MRGWAFVFKAEMVLGYQLVSRHRAPRFVIVLSAVFVFMHPMAEWLGGAVVPGEWLFPLVGTLAAVASSRLFAHGPALWAARSAIGMGGVVVAGRFAGAMIVVLPAVAVLGAVMKGGAVPVGVGTRAGIAALFAIVVGGVTVVVTPALGATAASLVGASIAWAGTLIPPAAHADSWPVATVRMVVDALPRLPTGAGEAASQASILRAGLWVAASMWLAAWTIARRRAPDA